MTEQLTLDVRDTQAILALIVADPAHERDVAAVVAAIRDVADDHGGRVDPNRVRPRIPAWVHKPSVGATYNALRRRGVLVPDGWTVSDDVAGGNAGKPARTYRWEDSRG